MSAIDENDLMKRARDVRANAYSPYYNVKVGAALLATDGRVFVGCNVENAAGPAIQCAEASALGAALAAGARSFRAIVIIGSDTALLYPCGICRQKLAEFTPSLEVIVASEDGKIDRHSLSALLPFPTRLP